MKQTVQYRSDDYLALELIVGWWHGFIKTHGDMLINALMRAQFVEVVCISRDNSMQLASVENEKIVGAFAFQAADEPLTDCIGSGSFGWRFDGLDARVLE